MWKIGFYNSIELALFFWAFFFHLFTVLYVEMGLCHWLFVPSLTCCSYCCCFYCSYLVSLEEKEEFCWHFFMIYVVLDFRCSFLQ